MSGFQNIVRPDNLRVDIGAVQLFFITELLGPLLANVPINPRRTKDATLFRQVSSERRSGSGSEAFGAQQ
jgi:hypothetical protein